MKKKMILIIVCIIVFCIAATGIAVNIISDNGGTKENENNNESFKAAVISCDDEYIVVEPLKEKDIELLGNSIKVRRKTVSPFSIMDFEGVSDTIVISYNTSSVHKENGINIIDTVFLIAYENETQESFTLLVQEVYDDYIIGTLKDESLIEKYGETIKVSTYTHGSGDEKYSADKEYDVVVSDMRYVVKEEYYYFYNVIGIADTK